jgi:hypothetical protein
MTWQQTIADNLVSPAEAVKVVTSGQHVNVAPFTRPT